jgi:cytochrome c oxidase cbb3-type subunit III
MLYPGNAKPPKVVVTLASGETITGSLASRDEFTIAITEPTGSKRSWSVNDVKFSVDDPMTAHFEQLGKYTDDDMHNVYAYLQSLK